MKRTGQNYRSGDTLEINGKMWVVREFRLGRGREWIYTLAHTLHNKEIERVTINADALSSVMNGDSNIGTYTKGTSTNVHP